MIKTLQELRALMIYQWPTRPVAPVRMVRVEHALIGVDQRGRVYTTLDHGSKRQFSRLRDNMQARLSKALGRLGMLAPLVGEQQDNENKAQRQKESAQWARDHYVPRLQELGVEFTDSQLLQLQRLAGDL